MISKSHLCYLLIGLIIIHIIPSSFAAETKEKIIAWDYPPPASPPPDHSSAAYLAYKTNEYAELFGNEKKLSMFLDNIKSLGINTITVPVLWSDIEPVEGSYTYDKYDKIFDLITKKDFKLIILPTGVSLGSPKWFWDKIQKQGKGMTTDFYKNQYPLLDIASDDAIKPFLDFYGNTTKHFISKYRHSIVAVGVGTSTEYEIKYSEFGYRWQTYSDEAQIKFQKWLQERYDLPILNKTWKTHYKSFDEITLPIIDYNTNGYSGRPDTNANFTDLMEFREDLLYNFTSKLSSKVKEEGADTLGYFGEFFAINDAIYTSMIDKAANLFDIVVVDTNFYDGYKISDRDLKGALMVNLAKNLGAKRVLFGVYGERLYPDYDDNLVTRYIQNTFIVSNPDGVEIGNFRPSEISQWSFLKNLPSLIAGGNSHGNATIAIYASKWNFYRWHGDIMSFNRDLWADSLYSTYQILTEYKGYQVDVIDDKVIEKHGLDQYKIMYLPSQTVVPLKIKSIIEHWLDNDGYAVQDWEFGNWDEYGNINGSINHRFGIIGPINWSSSNETLAYTSHRTQWIVSNQNATFHISSILLPQRTVEFMGSEAGFSSVLVDQTKREDNTLMIGNKTVIFGFQPQLVYFYDMNDSNRKAMADMMVEPIDLFLKNSTSSYPTREFDISDHKVNFLEDPIARVVRIIHEDGVFYNFPWFKDDINRFKEKLINSYELTNANKYLQQILMNQ